MRAVFDEREAAARGDGPQLVHRRRQPEGVLGQDRAGARSDARFDLFEVDVKGGGLDLEIHRSSARVQDGIGNHDASERRNQHLAVCDPQRLEDRGKGDATFPEERDVLRRMSR